MNRLSRYQRVDVVKALVEGNSIRATCRMTGTAKGTVLKLLEDLGRVCAAYQDEHLINLECARVECDEIWAFVGAKQKNVPEHLKGTGVGNVWTWVAIDATTKLVLYWTVGDRDAGSANEFMHGVASRLAHRVQLTTDGHGAYLDAVAGAFGLDVDYAQLIKKYGTEPAESREAATRYSPAVCPARSAR